MTYFLRYETPHGSTNILPYGDKQLASHAAVALRQYYGIEPQLFYRDAGDKVHVAF